MRMPSWLLSLSRQAGLVAAVSLSASLATAQTNTWNLVGVTFNDGTSVSGFITYDFGGNTITDWSISVQAGPGFTALTYDPGNSNSFTQNLGNPLDTLLIQVNASTRTFRITPVSNLD